MVKTPALHIVCGPDGGGKTTFAFKRIRTISGSSRFVNLDEIARGLSPLEPLAQAERAARVALGLIRSFIVDFQSFSLETTLAGKTHLRTIAQAKAAGFQVRLMFFAVATPEECLARVARRVTEGGHDVPQADLRRRFDRGLANLPAYSAACDFWQVFDATTPRPHVIAEGAGRKLNFRATGSAVRPEIDEWLNALPLNPPLPAAPKS